jgi:hypothetical protein
MANSARIVTHTDGRAKKARIAMFFTSQQFLQHEYIQEVCNLVALHPTEHMKELLDELELQPTNGAWEFAAAAFLVVLMAHDLGTGGTKCQE